MIAADFAGFHVGPSAGLIAYTLLFFCVALPCGVVTVMKGRWGWFAIGFVLGGLPWIVTAFLPARSGSAWARRAALRAE